MAHTRRASPNFPGQPGQDAEPAAASSGHQPARGRPGGVEGRRGLDLGRRAERARGPGRGAGSREPGGRAGRAGGNAGPRAAAAAGTAPPTPRTWQWGRGGRRSRLGVWAAPGPRPSALPPARAAPGVPPAAQQWPERLRPGAGKGAGPSSRGRGQGRWRPGRPRPLKGPAPPAPVGTTPAAIRDSRPATCVQHQPLPANSCGPRRRGGPAGRARRVFLQR